MQATFPKKNAIAAGILMLGTLLAFATAAGAQQMAAPAKPGFSSSQLTNRNHVNDSNFTNAANTRRDYVFANPLDAPFVEPSVHPEGRDIVDQRKSKGPGVVTHSTSGPVYVWPVPIPTAQSPVPSLRDVGIQDHTLKTFGLPVSDTQYQMIHRYNQNIMLAEMFDPERIMWAMNTTGAMQAQSAANSAANVERAQAASAIDFTASYLYNFTVDQGNRWNKLRDQLFIPMAILILLPGAVLAQVKQIVSAGMPVVDMGTSPFEGILRAIVAIFLIPATYLVINYGIDVSNSLTFTIAHEYQRMFGTDMYRDALCAQIRAFPIRQPNENQNGMFGNPTPWKPLDSVTPNNAKSAYEGLTSGNKVEDPCAGKVKAPADRADERAPIISPTGRLMANGSNAALAATWNVLCAFQMAYLYYLWCVGPVIAALWVWPMKQLRDALPSWCEGVLTLCFWSLFWNTVVLLMACFRGVDDTGTLIMSALNFLANQAVKSAFDFAGLVKSAGQQAAGQALGQSAHAASGAGSGARSQGAHGHRAGGGSPSRTTSGGSRGAGSTAPHGAPGAQHPGAPGGTPAGTSSLPGDSSGSVSRSGSTQTSSSMSGGGGGSYSGGGGSPLGAGSAGLNSLLSPYGAGGSSSGSGPAGTLGAGPPPGSTSIDAGTITGGNNNAGGGNIPSYTGDGLMSGSGLNLSLDLPTGGPSGTGRTGSDFPLGIGGMHASNQHAPGHIDPAHLPPGSHVNINGHTFDISGGDIHNLSQQQLTSMSAFSLGGDPASAGLPMLPGMGTGADADVPNLQAGDFLDIDNFNHNAGDTLNIDTGINSLSLPSFSNSLLATNSQFASTVANQWSYTAGLFQQALNSGSPQAAHAFIGNGTPEHPQFRQDFQNFQQQAMNGQIDAARARQQEFALQQYQQALSGNLGSANNLYSSSTTNLDQGTIANLQANARDLASNAATYAQQAASAAMQGAPVPLSGTGQPGANSVFGAPSGTAAGATGPDGLIPNLALQNFNQQMIRQLGPDGTVSGSTSQSSSQGIAPVTYSRESTASGTVGPLNPPVPNVPVTDNDIRATYAGDGSNVVNNSGISALPNASGITTPGTNAINEGIRYNYDEKMKQLKEDQYRQALMGSGTVDASQMPLQNVVTGQVPGSTSSSGAMDSSSVVNSAVNPNSAVQSYASQSANTVFGTTSGVNNVSQDAGSGITGNNQIQHQFNKDMVALLSGDDAAGGGVPQSPAPGMMPHAGLARESTSAGAASSVGQQPVPPTANNLLNNAVNGAAGSNNATSEFVLGSPQSTSSSISGTTGGGLVPGVGNEIGQSVANIIDSRMQAHEQKLAREAVAGGDQSQHTLQHHVEQGTGGARWAENHSAFGASQPNYSMPADSPASAATPSGVFTTNYNGPAQPLPAQPLPAASDSGSANAPGNPMLNEFKEGMSQLLSGADSSSSTTNSISDTGNAGIMPTNVSHTHNYSQQSASSGAELLFAGATNPGSNSVPAFENRPRTDLGLLADRIPALAERQLAHNAYNASLPNKPGLWPSMPFLPTGHMTMRGRATGQGSVRTPAGKPVQGSLLGRALSKGTREPQNQDARPAASQSRTNNPFGDLHIASLRRTRTNKTDQINKQSLNEFAENMEWQV